MHHVFFVISVHSLHCISDTLAFHLFQDFPPQPRTTTTTLNKVGEPPRGKQGTHVFSLSPSTLYIASPTPWLFGQNGCLPQSVSCLIFKKLYHMLYQRFDRFVFRFRLYVCRRLSLQATQHRHHTHSQAIHLPTDSPNHNTLSNSHSTHSNSNLTHSNNHSSGTHSPKHNAATPQPRPISRSTEAQNELRHGQVQHHAVNLFRLMGGHVKFGAKHTIQASDQLTTTIRTQELQHGHDRLVQ
jgi:hypothetical protein